MTKLSSELVSIVRDDTGSGLENLHATQVKLAGGLLWAGFEATDNSSSPLCRESSVARLMQDATAELTLWAETELPAASQNVDTAFGLLSNFFNSMRDRLTRRHGAEKTQAWKYDFQLDMAAVIRTGRRAVLGLSAEYGVLTIANNQVSTVWSPPGTPDQRARLMGVSSSLDELRRQFRGSDEALQTLMERLETALTRMNGPSRDEATRFERYMLLEPGVRCVLVSPSCVRSLEAIREMLEPLSSDDSTASLSTLGLSSAELIEDRKSGFLWTVSLTS